MVQEGFAAQAEFVDALLGRPAPRRRRRWPAAVLTLVLVTAALALLGLRLLGGSASADHPDRWAADVAPYAAFVERTRGLTFDHPVPVDRGAADTGTPGATYADGRLRLAGDGTASELVLVHGLTLVLLDQHFGSPGSREPVVAAIAEADAARIAAQWRREQPAGAVGDVAEPGEQPVAATSVLAAQLVAVAAQVGGDAAVDDLLRSPPRTDEPLLDPWTRLADHQGYLTVPTPDAGRRAEATAPVDVGALRLLGLLSARLPVGRVLTAVDGWGGAAAVGFRRDGADCLAAAVRGDTGADTTELQAALREWADAGPAGASAVTARAGAVVLRSCDPAAATATEPSAAVLAALVERSRLSAALVRDGVDVPTARCAGDRLVRSLPAGQRDLGARAPHVRAAVAVCAAG